MLEQVLMHLNNWFLVPGVIYEFLYFFDFGVIMVAFLANGQYFRICGSVFNDGLHQYPAGDLKTETFDGTVWALAVPQAVIELASEIEAWQKKNGEAAAGIYQSESFGGYSYSKATDAETGGAVTWQSAFKQQLSAWRKI